MHWAYLLFLHPGQDRAGWGVQGWALSVMRCSVATKYGIAPEMAFSSPVVNLTQQWQIEEGREKDPFCSNPHV